MTTKIRKKFKLLPKVSIIIPFYNSQEYINNCLDTIIKGTHISYEIICVDDGSTDDTSLIVKNYSKCNKNIRLISLKENKGLYLARLIGVRYSRGEYIGFVDSDDFHMLLKMQIQSTRVFITYIGSKVGDVIIGMLYGINCTGEGCGKICFLY